MQHIQDIRLMMKCCNKYYFEEISQAAIAKQLGISHPTVCRLIKQAKELGMVQINLVNTAEQEDYTKLEHELEHKYGLREVIVVPDKDTDRQQKQEIGRAASAYLARMAGKHSIIGVSMGTSLQEMASCDYTPPRGNHLFVPLIGGVGQKLLEVQSNQLVNEFAKKFGGRAVFLHTPSVIHNMALRDSLLGDTSVQETFQYYDQMDMAVISIGAPVQGCTLLLTGFYPDEMMQQLFEEGVVGDVCLQFFDAEGNHRQYTVNNQVVGMELDRFKTLKHSIGLASGIHKTRAIIGAIRAKFINVLITHHTLAQRLLATARE